MGLMQTIDALTLRGKMHNNEPLLLIDVREEWEHAEFNIGGLLVPMGTVLKRVKEIPTDIPVVFYCKKGIRSGLVIQRLLQKYPYNNLMNLNGGIDGWLKQDDR